MCSKCTPSIAVDDPGLMVGMPKSLTAATGMDALTHSIEAYVSTASNPVTGGAPRVVTGTNGSRASSSLEELVGERVHAALPAQLATGCHWQESARHCNRALGSWRGPHGSPWLERQHAAMLDWHSPAGILAAGQPHAPASRAPNESLSS